MPRAAFFALGEQASRLRVADGVGNYFCYPCPQAEGLLSWLRVEVGEPTELANRCFCETNVGVMN